MCVMYAYAYDYDYLPLMTSAIRFGKCYKYRNLFYWPKNWTKYLCVKLIIFKMTALLEYLDVLEKSIFMHETFV